MEEFADKDEARWEQITENMDILFAKVAEIDAKQQRLDTKVDMSTTVLEQMLKDQQLLTKQIDITGQAVAKAAKLTLNQMNNKQESPPSPTSSDTSTEHEFDQYKHPKPNFPEGSKGGFSQQRKYTSGKFSMKSMVPKMSFPKFDGTDPCIWKDKCQDYFTMFNIPAGIWTTMASLNMEDKAARWLKVYKLQHGLGDW
jgi:hypothetical protein